MTARIHNSTTDKVPSPAHSSTLSHRMAEERGEGMLDFVNRCDSAFTLIEVLLAIFIASGILVVLLYFYQQATHLRAQAIQETERIAAAGLIMDKITSELRTTPAETAFGRGFAGGSNTIQFVKT